jgi:hypothetical protein
MERLRTAPCVRRMDVKGVGHEEAFGVGSRAYNTPLYGLGCPNEGQGQWRSGPASNLRKEEERVRRDFLLD